MQRSLKYNGRQDLSLYSILLAHRPEHIDLYLNYSFDLVYPGIHTEGSGGYTILNGLYAPNQGFRNTQAGSTSMETQLIL